MMNILKNFPYFGITEKIFERVPKEYLKNYIYKESTPKQYGQSLKRHKKK